VADRHAGLAARALLVLWAAALLAAAAYQGLIALDAIPPGDQPGETPPGLGPLVTVCLASLLAGGVALLASGLARADGPPGGGELVAIPVAAALYAVASHYAYDPYYLPTLRRASEGGLPTPALALLAACAVGCAAGLAVRAWRRPATIGTGTLLLALLVALASTGGH
jgi:hypothetical protein